MTRPCARATVGGVIFGRGDSHPDPFPRRETRAVVSDAVILRIIRT